MIFVDFLQAIEMLMGGEKKWQSYDQLIDRLLSLIEEKCKITNSSNLYMAQKAVVHDVQKFVYTLVHSIFLRPLINLIVRKK